MKKRFLLWCWFCVALAFALPLLLRPAGGSARPAEGAGSPLPAEEGQSPRPAAEDAALRLAVLTGDGVCAMSMADWLFPALAAEMPASFEPAALEAQAVALRTYALRQSGARKAAHPDADVCGDPGCCCALASEELLRGRWGGEYETYAARLRAAIAATDGQYLAWEGEPILAVFHASSWQRTEDGAALGVAEPYLRSVETPETAARVRDLNVTVELSPRELADTLGRLDGAADFGGEASEWLGAVRLDDAGRVESVELGGRPFSGLALRAALGLRSTDFTPGWDGEKFTFRVRGYGHGLGLSQYGAQCMALDGASYGEILEHYYPGTELQVR